MPGIASSGTVRRSWSSTAMSASLPTSRVPLHVLLEGEIGALARGAGERLLAREALVRARRARSRRGACGRPRGGSRRTATAARCRSRARRGRPPRGARAAGAMREAPAGPSCAREHGAVLPDVAAGVAGEDQAEVPDALDLLGPVHADVLDDPPPVGDRHRAVHALVEVEDVRREAADADVVPRGLDHHLDHDVLGQRGLVREARPAGVGGGRPAQPVLLRVVRLRVEPAHAQVLVAEAAAGEPGAPAPQELGHRGRHRPTATRDSTAGAPARSAGRARAAPGRRRGPRPRCRGPRRRSWCRTGCRCAWTRRGRRPGPPA